MIGKIVVGVLAALFSLMALGLLGFGAFGLYDAVTCDIDSDEFLGCMRELVIIVGISAIVFGVVAGVIAGFLWRALGRIR